MNKETKPKLTGKKNPLAKTKLIKKHKYEAQEISKKINHRKTLIILNKTGQDKSSKQSLNLKCVPENLEKTIHSEFLQSNVNQAIPKNLSGNTQQNQDNKKTHQDDILLYKRLQEQQLNNISLSNKAMSQELQRQQQYERDILEYKRLKQQMAKSQQ